MGKGQGAVVSTCMLREAFSTSEEHIPVGKGQGAMVSTCMPPGEHLHAEAEALFRCNQRSSEVLRGPQRSSERERERKRERESPSMAPRPPLAARPEGEHSRTGCRESRGEGPTRLASSSAPATS